MKILVMGGTRFVGKSLVKKLLSFNYDVDIFTRGNRPNLHGTNLIKGDRNDIDNLKKIGKSSYDIVFDISGRELIQTKMLIENINTSFKRYIYVSSAGVYKDNFELPINELDPVDYQSRHKGKLETEDWLINQKIPFTSFRPTYIYGPGNYNKIENWFFERLYNLKEVPIPGDGSLITQLGHVSDLTDAMIKSFNYKNALNNIYNCSGEKGITIKGLIFKCVEVLNLKIENIKLIPFNYENMDAKSRKSFPLRLNHYQTSISKIKNDLEWKPRFDLFSGLKDSFNFDFETKMDDDFVPPNDGLLFNS